MSEDVINIRSIQHFLYCPHRWGLIEIGKVWAENFYVTKANLIHKKVHDFSRSSSRNKKVFTNISVYNNLPGYNLYGVLDCLEISNDNITIVEYKPSKPKNAEYHFEDLMQVFSQKLCVDYVFKSDCEAYIYYADTKKRIRLPLKENFSYYDRELKSIINKINTLLKLGKIPPVEKNQNCNGCSMKELCIPKTNKIKSVRDEIMKSVSEGGIFDA